MVVGWVFMDFGLGIETCEANEIEKVLKCSVNWAGLRHALLQVCWCLRLSLSSLDRLSCVGCSYPQLPALCRCRLLPLVAGSTRPYIRLARSCISHSPHQGFRLKCQAVSWGTWSVDTCPILSPFLEDADAGRQRGIRWTAGGGHVLSHRS